MQKVSELMQSYRRMTVRTMDDKLYINYETIRQSLKKQMGKRNICALQFDG